MAKAVQVQEVRGTTLLLPAKCSVAALQSMELYPDAVLAAGVILVSPCNNINATFLVLGSVPPELSSGMCLYQHLVTEMWCCWSVIAVSAVTV